MFRFVITLIVSLAATTLTLEDRRFRSSENSVASDAQIQFALENKYDDTGPGSKQPEYAYNTYKSLEEALIAFLDDPDTKLPEHHRSRAIQRLVSQHQPTQPHTYVKPIMRHYPKTVEEYTGYKPPQPTPTTKYTFPEKKFVYQPSNSYQASKVGILDLRGLSENDILSSFPSESIQPYRLQRIQPVKGSPINLAHYSRYTDLQPAQDQFDPHPKYTYSYGVHDKDTGDSKTAHETRTGGTVHGFYSFTDADGRQRTVQYTADDDHGFRANVDRRH